MRKLFLSAIAVAGLTGAAFGAEGDDLFTKLDANKDGFVGPDEVGADQKSLFERLLRNADKDGDKKLSKDEFAAGLKGGEEPRQPLPGAGGPGRPGGAQFNPGEIFDRFDANKDGKISKDEAPDRMKENFDRLDSNSDGGVTQEELRRAFAAGGPPGAPGNPAARPDGKQAEELFDRTDANSDGKLTKDEVPEDKREGFSRLLERIGADSVTKEQFVRFMQAQGGGVPGQPGSGRPEGGPPGGFRPPLVAALDADGDGELSSGEIEAASKSLLKLDKNSDGKLTRDELGPPPGSPGGRPGQPGPGEAAGRFVAEMISRAKAADANNDGKLSKDEAPDRLKENFDRIDRNSDGFIDETELRQMIERMREGFGAGRPEGAPRRPDGERPARPDGEK
ncbi:MAG: EF-hand domain-containing protein [Pirellulaceae bacterium]|nr:EF-hand domain-containing protein [Pirellulaceae bacterium]